MIFYGKWVGKYTVRPMNHLDHQQKPSSPDHSVSTTAGFQIRSLPAGNGVPTLREKTLCVSLRFGGHLSPVINIEL